MYSVTSPKIGHYYGLQFISVIRYAVFYLSFRTLTCNISYNLLNVYPM